MVGNRYAHRTSREVRTGAARLWALGLLLLVLGLTLVPAWLAAQLGLPLD